MPTAAALGPKGLMEEADVLQPPCLPKFPEAAFSQRDLEGSLLKTRGLLLAGVDEAADDCRQGYSSGGAGRLDGAPQTSCPDRQVERGSDSTQQLQANHAIDVVALVLMAQQAQALDKSGVGQQVLALDKVSHPLPHAQRDKRHDLAGGSCTRALPLPADPGCVSLHVQTLPPPQKKQSAAGRRHVADRPRTDQAFLKQPLTGREFPCEPVDRSHMEERTRQRSGVLSLTGCCEIGFAKGAYLVVFFFITGHDDKGFQGGGQIPESPLWRAKANASSAYLRAMG